MVTEELTDAELEAWEEAQGKAREAELKALDSEARRLKKRFVDDGKRLDTDFRVLTTTVGNFVVGKPEFVSAKRFNAVENKTEEDVIRFVLPSVLFPERGAMSSVFQEHGGIAWALATEMLKMYSADAGARAKK